MKKKNSWQEFEKQRICSDSQILDVIDGFRFSPGLLGIAKNF
jgi:hypothetical protein